MKHFFLHNMIYHRLLRIVLLIQLLLFASCFVKNNLSGEYVLKNNSALIQTFLRLNNNRTFVASSHDEVGGKFESRGKWSVNADTLVLNMEADIPPFVAYWKNDLALKSLKIEVREKRDSSLLKFSKVYINGKMLDPQQPGVFMSGNNDIEKIEIQYLSNKYEVPLNVKVSNYLIVYFDLKSGHNSLNLANKWLVRGHQLNAVDGFGMTFFRSR